MEGEKTMALTMQSADVAVSRQGIEKFRSQLSTNASYAKRRIYPSSQYYQNMIRMIRENWVGVDADNFLRDLNIAAQDISTLCDDIYNRLTQAFNNYYSNFLKMQNSTYTKGQIRIRK